jgi:hypothetical protein
MVHVVSTDRRAHAAPLARRICGSSILYLFYSETACAVRADPARQRGRQSHMPVEIW